ncbi:hypothetical protein [Kocuria sp. HSID16901]|uniref:hypothetical protein n=1 Tax=Kocuria sp. HSID16901 TaxID=2419505 RepID=UPI00080A8E5B|nr:hypothetical protein [Kocuria sp. HSID16901]MCT1366981.1 hypothetical protein [Rothia sp. p3-SID1597]
MMHITEVGRPLMKKMLDEIFNQRRVPLEEIVETYFARGYRQRTNGSWSTRDEFVSHLSRVRDVVESMDITVASELVEGERYADHHILRIHKRNGESTVQEVYAFARRDQDGRFLELQEVTLMTVGSETDRGLGQA